MERTFVRIYPDGIHSGLIGEIISRFEKKGFHLKGLKLLQNGGPNVLEKIIPDLSNILYCTPKLYKEFHLPGATVCMVWEGENVVTIGRKMIGATNSEPGTICGDFSIDMGSNVIYGSDSLQTAKEEVDFWFPEGLEGKTNTFHKLITDLIFH